MNLMLSCYQGPRFDTISDGHVKVDITVKGVSDIESYTPEHIAEKYDG